MKNMKAAGTQKQENGEELTEAQIKERIRKAAEAEKRYKEELINRYLITNIGKHYVINFTEEKMRERAKIEKKTNEMLNDGKGIILSGGVGVGKTMSLIYIIRSIVKGQEDYIERVLPDIPIAYYFMPHLFQLLHFGEKVKTNKFIVLDDWGREYAEPFALSQFECLIEKIYSREYKLVITTNLTKKQFINRQGWGRITDRVREMCAFIEINGTSQRHR